MNESTDAGGIGAILKFGDLVGDEHRLSHETDNKIGTSEAANENVRRRMEKRRLPDHKDHYNVPGGRHYRKHRVKYAANDVRGKEASYARRFQSC